MECPTIGIWFIPAAARPQVGLWIPAEPNTMVFDTVSESKPLRDDQLIALMGNTGGRGGGRGAA